MVVEQPHSFLAQMRKLPPLRSLCALRMASSQAHSRNSSIGEDGSQAWFICAGGGPSTRALDHQHTCSALLLCLLLFQWPEWVTWAEAAGQQEASALKEGQDVNVSCIIVLWQHQENCFLIKVMNALVIWTQESQSHTPSHWILLTTSFLLSQIYSRSLTAELNTFWMKE